MLRRTVLALLLTVLASSLAVATSLPLTMLATPSQAGHTTFSTSAAALFAPATSYAAGYHPRRLVQGDFNGDSKIDLAVPNWYGYQLSVLPGTGTGIFTSTRSFGNGMNPFSLATADLNNDHQLDLVTVNPDSNAVSVFLGTGAGTFPTSSSYIVGAQPYDVAIADMNNDTRPDLVVANYSGNSISVLLGNGAGAFSNLAPYPVGLTPFALALGDLNGDGSQDVVVTNYDANTISVLAGNGTGAFGSATAYPVGVHPRCVAIADLNGDGVQDLVVANVDSSTISILIGTGNGGFASAQSLATADWPNYLTIDDINGDGLLDVITASGAGNVALLYGKGNGAFAAPVVYSTGGDSDGVIVGDLNGDGRRDLAVENFASHNVSILLQTDAVVPTPSPTATPLPTSTPGPAQPPVIDAFSVNGGALATTSASTILNLSASDPNDTLASLQMSFSNDGISWGTWKAYTDKSSWQLLSGDGPKSVYARVKDPGGNISAIVSDTITLDTSAQPEYGISINSGALYTRDVSVRLTLSAQPGTIAMQISNDGGFAQAQWEPFTTSRRWTISGFRSSAIPRLVYVRYRDSNGTTSAASSDDIILDMRAPDGDVHVVGDASSALRTQGAALKQLQLNATDDVSGVSDMRLSHQASFDGAVWEPYAATRSWDFSSGSTVYVQFRDYAGNESVIYTAQPTVIYRLYLPWVGHGGIPQ